MHEVLRQRLLRKIDSLPEEQVYQVLDYIEFLESKYARHLPQEATGLQKFAEGLEDRLRKKAVSPATIREAFQLIAAADRVLSSVSTAGSRLLGELGSLAEGDAGGASAPPAGTGASGGSGARTGRTPAGGSAPAAGPRPGAAPRSDAPRPHGDPLKGREGGGEGTSGQGSGQG